MADDSYELGTDGFANGERYDSVRPDYPRAAVAYLVDSLGIDSDAHVVDLGAGTGIFTNQLVPFGPRITAVEPTAGMRDVLAKRLPSIRVLEGRDVEIPLEDSSVDCVIAAQAFHWFDAPLALEEIHRVLVDGGRLGLVWNERDESVAWVGELGRAMRWPQFQPYEMGKDFTPVIAAGPFVNVERRKFAHLQMLSHDQLVQRVLSTSYIAVMDEDERAVVMDSVAGVILLLPDPVELPYVTDVYRATAMLR
ncbi:MAG: class I SAM-dependent methyltransferase [Acidimicrobiales bacterium]